MKSFFQLKFTTLYTGQERHNSYFSYLTTMACSEVAAFLQTAGAVFRMFSRQCHNGLVLAARLIANNLSPIDKKF